MQNLHQTSKQKQRKSRMEKGRKGLKSYWSVLTEKQKIFYSSFHFKVNKVDFILFCRPNRRYLESSDESEEEPPPKRKQGKIRQNGQNLLCYNLLCYQGLFLNKRNIHAHNCAQNAKMLQDLFSLNREMQQAARDITPPLPSLQSTCTSSMMESTSSKTSGKQFYIYLDFLLR